MSQLALIAPPAPAPESHGYRCVLADPPWPEHGGGGRGAQNHYPLLTVPEIIAAMVSAEPWARVHRDAHLWLWAPSRIWMALQVAEALGFSQVGYATWRKTGGPGLGQYLRYESEIVLLCTRGRAMVPERAGRQVIEAPRRLHSQKPPEFYDQVFERVSPGPRVEFFARARRDGWDAWGNEVPA